MITDTGLTAPQLKGAVWWKSSYSGSSEGQCVECANVKFKIAIRDSKTPEGAKLLFTPGAFSGFIAAVKSADLD